MWVHVLADNPPILFGRQQVFEVWIAHVVWDDSEIGGAAWDFWGLWGICASCVIKQQPTFIEQIYKHNFYNNNNNNNNKLKHKRLCVEIKRMWNLKCTIIPIIIGVTGIVTRSLRKNLEAVPGKHSIDSLQKTAIIGTSHIIRKVLQCEAWSLSGGDHRWFNRSTGKKRPVTRDMHIE